MKPIKIDLSGLQAQFGLAAKTVDVLTETCVNAVTASIYVNWEALAKQELKSTLDEYVSNIKKVDKGRFSKQIVLTGILPNMVEQGASAFDIKVGFKNSKKVKYTIPVYDKKGNVVSKGGDWYLTIPFRIGVPGTLGQAGFSGVMPQEVYDVMKKRNSNKGLPANIIPSPFDIPQSRDAIMNEKQGILYNAYQHKNSIYEGLLKKKAEYKNTNQNSYGTFRRAGSNSDPLSWIHKGITKHDFAGKAVEKTDVKTIVENEVLTYLDKTL